MMQLNKVVLAEHFESDPRYLVAFVNNMRYELARANTGATSLRIRVVGRWRDGTELQFGMVGDWR